MEYVTYTIKEIIARTGNTDDTMTNLFKQIVQSDDHWIAGGAGRAFITNEKLNDIDVFFKSQNSFDRFMDRMKDGSYKEIFSTDSAITFEVDGIRIQAIRINFFNSIEECLNNFDFTVCQIAITHDSKVIVGKWTMWDLGRKRLVINHLEYPVATVMRMIKYSKYGYRPCTGTVDDLFRRVIDNPEMLNSSIKYID